MAVGRGAPDFGLYSDVLVRQIRDGVRRPPRHPPCCAVVSPMRAWCALQQRNQTRQCPRVGYSLLVGLLDSQQPDREAGLLLDVVPEAPERGQAVYAGLARSVGPLVGARSLSAGTKAHPLDVVASEAFSSCRRVSSGTIASTAPASTTSSTFSSAQCGNPAKVRARPRVPSGPTCTRAGHVRCFVTTSVGCRGFGRPAIQLSFSFPSKQARGRDHADGRLIPGGEPLQSVPFFASSARL